MGKRVMMAFGAALTLAGLAFAQNISNVTKDLEAAGKNITGGMGNATENITEGLNASAQNITNATNATDTGNLTK